MRHSDVSAKQEVPITSDRSDGLFFTSKDLGLFFGQYFGLLNSIGSPSLIIPVVSKKLKQDTPTFSVTNCSKLLIHTELTPDSTLIRM